LQRTPSSIG